MPTPVTSRSSSGAKSVPRFKTALRVHHVFWGLALLAFAGQAHATTVGCAGSPSGSYDFSTLTAAFYSSNTVLTNNTITVYGTCTEDAIIYGAQNLTIQGAPGAILMQGGNPNYNAVLEFHNSQGVTLQGLTIQLVNGGPYGGFTGVAFFNTGATLLNCDIEGITGSDGMHINALSNVQLLGTNTIENNNDGAGGGEGIFLTGPGAGLTIGNTGYPPVAGCTTIQNSGDDGILASGQATVTITPFGTCAVLQNNGNMGIQADQGAVASLTVDPNIVGSSIHLLNNQVGAGATTDSYLAIQGPVLIQGNTYSGVSLDGGIARITAAAAKGATIQGNGSLAAGGDQPAGIAVTGHSYLIMHTGAVINNSGAGIFIQDNSSVKLVSGGRAPLNVAQNPIGILVVDDSTLSLNSAPSITGNVNGDVVCRTFSVAHGDSSAVGKINCPAVKPDTNANGSYNSQGDN